MSTWLRSPAPGVLDVENPRADLDESKGLLFYVITSGTSDFPDHFIVRRHLAIDGELYAEATAYADAASLELARLAIPDGLARLGRLAGDDAVIVESWL